MVAVLPAFARIQELRFCIRNQADDVARPFNRAAPFSSPFREMWSGELLFAPMSRPHAHALSAFLEGLDGRVTPFMVPFGNFSQPFTQLFDLALAATPDLQDDTLTFSLFDSASPNYPVWKSSRLTWGGRPLRWRTGTSGISGRIHPGTLISVGNPDTDNFQMFEVLQSAAYTGSLSVKVAPRVRCEIVAGDPVAIGRNVRAKLRLADDQPKVNMEVGYGVNVLNVVEAV